ncbi:MAG: hypothetical protein ACTHQQ_05295 [Solirubrobacteraceae bacterium]
MPASNIHSVDLAADGKVTISGTFTDMDKRKVTLLHVWLAQPGGNGLDGVGLAIDALDPNTKPGFNPTKHSFEINALGANNAMFREGPAIVSAIAVISPVDASAGLPTEVLQWDRSLTLSQAKTNHVKLSIF